MKKVVRYELYGGSGTWEKGVWWCFLGRVCTILDGNMSRDSESMLNIVGQKKHTQNHTFCPFLLTLEKNFFFEDLYLGRLPIGPIHKFDNSNLKEILCPNTFWMYIVHKMCLVYEIGKRPKTKKEPNIFGFLPPTNFH